MRLQFIGEELLSAKERLKVNMRNAAAPFERFEGDTGSSEVQGARHFHILPPPLVLRRCLWRPVVLVLPHLLWIAGKMLGVFGLQVVNSSDSFDSSVSCKGECGAVLGCLALVGSAGVKGWAQISRVGSVQCRQCL